MKPPNQLKQDLVVLLPRLQRYAKNLNRSAADADDLLQATCIRVLEKWQQFKPGSDFDRWVFTIMSSIRSNHLRAENTRHGAGLVDAHYELATEDPHTRNIFHDQVLDEVQQLPIAHRQVLLLVYVEGFTYQETANILDVPVGTVMSRIARGRARLAAQFSANSKKPSHVSSSSNEA